MVSPEQPNPNPGPFLFGRDLPECQFVVTFPPGNQTIVDQSKAYTKTIQGQEPPQMVIAFELEPSTWAAGNLSVIHADATSITLPIPPKVRKFVKFVDALEFPKELIPNPVHEQKRC